MKNFREFINESNLNEASNKYFDIVEYFDGKQRVKFDQMFDYDNGEEDFLYRMYVILTKKGVLLSEAFEDIDDFCKLGLKFSKQRVEVNLKASSIYLFDDRMKAYVHLLLK